MLRNTDCEKRKRNVSQHILSKSFKYERDNKNNRTTQDRFGKCSIQHKNI